MNEPEKNADAGSVALDAGLGVSRFAPTILTRDGRAVTPEGWMWILGFALGGCQWAIDEVSTPEFRERYRAWKRASELARIESEIAHFERRIEALKARIPQLTPNAGNHGPA
jgi:hypothetical protein